jgi:CHAT domain-containing protein
MADEERMDRLLAEAAAFAASDAFPGAAGWERLIDLNERALAAAPQETSHHGMVANQLAELLGQRAGLSGDAEHWQAAISRVQTLLETVPDDDWRFPLYVLADGAMHYRRAVASGNPEHITPALSRLEAAKSRVRRGAGIYLTACAYLADLYYRRYVGTRDPLDLESAIAAAFAVGDGPARRHERVLALTVLAAGMGSRFGLTREAVDVEAAVRFADDAVADAEGAGEMMPALRARATARRMRYGRSGDRDDLDVAIGDYEALVKMVEDPTDRAHSLDNYGNGLFDRYELDRQPQDLADAIRTSEDALALLPSGAHGRARMQRNRGVALLAQYRDTSDMDALDQAVGAFVRGLAELGEDSEQRPLLLACLADAHLQQAARQAPGEEPLDAALALFERVETLIGSGSELPIPYALAVGQAAGTADSHLGALLWRAAEQEGSERDATLRRALAVAESTKSRELAGEITQMALSAPPEVPEGASWMEQYLLAELGRLDAQELARTGDYGFDALRLTRMDYRRRLARDLGDVWNEIAAVSDEAAYYVAERRGGTGRWIGALESADEDTIYISVATAIDLPADVAARMPRPRKLVVLAVRGGPHGAVAVSERRGDQSDDVVRRFTAEVPDDRGLGMYRETWDRELTSLLRELGEQVGTVGRVTISPSARARSLPWALVLERAGWRAPDDAPLPVDTVPTLALLAARTPRTPAGTRWHAVRNAARSFGLDDPEGLGEAIGVVRPVSTGPATGPPLVVGDPRADLPGATDEALQVAEILGTEPLIGRRATVDAVRNALSDASLVHLAAHARFDPTSPLDSPVLLADGELTARDLIGEYSGTELIVLSACESGVGGGVVGNEIVGVAHALLRTGARGVLASLWPVDDDSTATLMATFHRKRVAGADPAAALAAAAATVRERPEWSRPYYWASFIVAEVR